MVGQYINKGMIDQMSSQTIINMRNAMVAMEYLIQWMAMNPVVNGEDMLVTNTEDFGYTIAEAAQIRAYFSGMDAVFTNNAAAFNAGRGFTGFF